MTKVKLNGNEVTDFVTYEKSVDGGKGWVKLFVHDYRTGERVKDDDDPSGYQTMTVDGLVEVESVESPVTTGIDWSNFYCVPPPNSGVFDPDGNCKCCCNCCYR